METDLSIRLRAYSTAVEVTVREPTRLYADALACSRAASAAASAAIICSHPRELRAGAEPGELNPGQDEPDLPIAGKAAGKAAKAQSAPSAGKATDEPGEESHRVTLPLPPGENSLANVALGASGIPAIKSKNG